VVSRRLGRSSFGCLLGLLLSVTAVYFAVNVGEPYLRYYRYVDGMKQVNDRLSQRFPTDTELEARTRSYDLAYRMQVAAGAATPSFDPVLASDRATGTPVHVATAPLGSLYVVVDRGGQDGSHHATILKLSSTSN